MNFAPIAMPTERPSGDASRRHVRTISLAARVALACGAMALTASSLAGGAGVVPTSEPAGVTPSPAAPTTTSTMPTTSTAPTNAATPTANTTTPAVTTPPAEPDKASVAAPASGNTATVAPTVSAASRDVAARALGAPADPIVDAREALRRRDGQRLAALRTQVASASHPLASWVEYWELTNRIEQAQAAEVETFYTRWKGRYVEDRLRNDWLLELGRRRDWPQLRVDFPRFRMNDDREVTCYALVARHLEGKPVKDEALEAWLDQKDLDDGCHLLGTTLVDARVFGRDEVWRKVRRAIDQGRPRVARQAAGIVGEGPSQAVADIVSQPARWLNHKAETTTRQGSELTAIALARLAGSDPELATLTLRSRWATSLPPELLAWTWAQIAEHATQKVMPDAHDHALAALKAADASPLGASALGDESLAWTVRAALRSTHSERWRTIDRAIAAMRPATRDDATWRYWSARAALADSSRGTAGQGSAASGSTGTSTTGASPGDAADARRTQARAALMDLAGELHFYGVLAAEDLGQRFTLPALPPAADAAEREAARSHPGLASGLAMIAAGLRDEGNREWNYSLRGMADRELIAAAQWACEREVWDRCINTSDRSRSLVDVAQRYPTPFRRALDDAAGASNLETAFAYGIIRQESRFITTVRSHVGASGLMQIMPATARWTAKRLGLSLPHGSVTDPQTNLRLGTHYLKLVLDDFEGSHAMAAAAYNAGPSRPRRWREGPVIEAAAWAETIPFDETRDYVKKVLTNTVVYAALLGADATRTSLKARLGASIGPREAAARTVDRDLP